MIADFNQQFLGLINSNCVFPRWSILIIIFIGENGSN